MQLVIIGAGGFGREVVDIIDALNATSVRPSISVLGFIDDGQPDVETLQPYGLDVIMGTSEMSDLPDDTHYAIGIGSPAARRTMDERAAGAGLRAATLIHPSVSMGRGVAIGDGSILCAGVRLTNNVTLGRHVHVNLNATIGHDAVLDDFVTVSPLVAVSGYVRLQSQVMVGTGVSINPGVTIGASATIGSGAAVLKDVPAGAVAVGVPARQR